MAKYIVEISDSVILSMILNGLESFLLTDLASVNVRKSEKCKGHEIDGYIFGSRKREGDIVKYRVKYLNINTTSRANQNSVRSEEHVQDLKRKLFESLFTRNKFLGKFHTHPYRLRECRDGGISEEFFHGMYQPSKPDENLGGEPGQLDLILAMVNGHGNLKKGLRYTNNCKYCVHFDIARIRLFIGAYVREGENGSYAPYCSVDMEIPGFLGKLPQNFDFEELSHLLKI